MEAKRSKVEQICDAIRLGLEKGRHIPGDRIDADALALKFRTSLTPVRYALYCLWTEDVLENHGRAGFCVPLLDEADLIDLYDSAESQLIPSCGIGHGPSKGTVGHLDLKKRNSDVVVLTRQLFGAMVFASGRRSLCMGMRIANGRLGSIRRIERKLIDDARGELISIHRLWQRGDPGLRAALFEYHERRRRMAPKIVAVMRAGVRRADK
ncbi:MAG: GntR family transcriptional regulator [Dokdonella sp.]|nr:GntR family transcriptional regulator [Dokdonella sp.]